MNNAITNFKEKHKGLLTIIVLLMLFFDGWLKQDEDAVLYAVTMARMD